MRLVAEQVRPAERSDEQEVAGEKELRHVGRAEGVVDEKTQMLRRVSRRVDRHDSRRTKIDDVAVAEVLMGHADLVLLACVMARRTVCRAGTIRQLARAGREVGVDVRLEDVGDPQFSRGREVEVDVHVTPRVDDGGDAGARAADNIGVLREALVFNAFEDHWSGRGDEWPRVARPRRVGTRVQDSA